MKKTLLVVALFIGGCVTKSTVTEGDRQVTHQIVGAAELVIADPGFGGLGTAVQLALNDIVSCAQHLEEVHQPPDQPLPYNHANAEKAKADSTAEHAGGGFLGILKAGGGILLSIVMTYFGVDKIAKRFPQILAVGRALKHSVEQIDQHAPTEITQKIVTSNPLVKQIWDAIPETSTLPKPPA